MIPNLPEPANKWDINQLTAERTAAVAAFGFTERQARFLVEVMLHSGVFVERQYCTFAGIVHGQKTHDFLRKLVERGFAQPVQVGALHRGRLFHISHKPLYTAIGEADNRHRKTMPIGRMVERLMVLDAVLADRTFTWLGTETDKRRYFMRLLGDRLKLEEYPHLSFGSGDTIRRRLFPDKLPIGIEHDWREHVFVYLVTKPLPIDFRLFVYRHAEFLRWVPRWTLRVLVPQPIAKAIRMCGLAAREEFATPIAPNTAEELQWYFRERQGSEQGTSPSDEKRFRSARMAFRTPRFRVLYRVWRQHGDPAIWAAQSHVLRNALERRDARVEFVQLSHQYLHLSSLVGVA